MKRFWLWSVVVLLLVSLLIVGCAPAPSPTPAPAPAPAPKPAAPSAADFYKGKTITAMVPGKPGSTFDLVTRVIAPVLEKQTGATVIVQNSSNIESENKLNSAVPDGLMVTLCGHGPKIVGSVLFKEEGVKYDFRNFTYLGKLLSSASVLYITKTLPYEKASDMRDVAFLMGASSPFYEPLFLETLGMSKGRVVPGLSGSERSMAMRRGELQATTGGAAQLTIDPDILKPIAVSVPEKQLPNVPVAADIAVKGREKIGQILGSFDQIMYWCIATPNIPKERADFLTAALEKVYQDAAFRDGMKKAALDLSEKFVTGKELADRARTLATLSADEIKELANIVTDKYMQK